MPNIEIENLIKSFSESVKLVQKVKAQMDEIQDQISPEIKKGQSRSLELLNEIGKSAEDVFKFRWTVAGCTSAGAMPWTYTWSDDVTPDPDDPTVAIQVPEGPGTYGPTVTVVNTAGVSKEISCRQVNYSNNYSN